MANFGGKLRLLNKLIFPVIMLMLLAGKSKASIKLNEKWTQNASGLWSLSFTPTGTFDPLISKSTTCYDPGPDGKCIGYWVISVRGSGGNVSKACSPQQLFYRGTSYGTAISTMQKQTIGVECTLSNIQINGDEKICISSSASGSWKEGTTGYPFGVPFYGSSLPCDYGGGTGGIQPPVKPASCSIGDILFNHGSVTSDELNGAKTSLQSMIQCTQKATVKITIQNSGKINLNNDGSLYSIISIDDNGAEATMLINTEKNVNFTSIIYYRGNGMLTGDFNNSSILSLEIQ